MRWISFVATLAALGWTPAARSQAAVEPLTTPAGADSGRYSLAAGADGRTYLVWIEPTVTTGKREGSYAYGIRVATSQDAGRTWRTTFEEGMRNVKDYAGFLSFLPTRDGVDAVFLTPVTPDDGTDTEHERTKTLGTVRLAADGTAGPTSTADADVCSCCSTDMAMTSAGPIAVYRDHAAGEIRDISIVRRVNGQWTAPAPAHGDNWHIAGCPTNGPAVAASGAGVVVAWFTAAGNTPAVNVAFSADAGATFGAPVRVDDGAPVGWPDVLRLEDGRALVTWLERVGEGKVQVRLGEVAQSGAAPAITVGSATSGRGPGIPMMARGVDQVIVAWRDGRVQTARVPVPAAPTIRRNEARR